LSSAAACRRRSVSRQGGVSSRPFDAAGLKAFLANDLQAAISVVRTSS
jgi:hypothetical protein